MTLNPDLETLTAHAIQHWSKRIKHNGFLGPLDGSRLPICSL